MGQQAGDDIATWIRNALREERQEIDRLLAQRHERLLQQLQRQVPAAPTAAAPQEGRSGTGGGVPACTPEEQAHRNQVAPGSSEGNPRLEHKDIVGGAKSDDHEGRPRHLISEEDSGHESRPEVAVWQSVRSNLSIGSVASMNTEQAGKYLAWVDVISGVAILLNLFSSALETQYNGYDLECILSKELELEGMSALGLGLEGMCAAQRWPGMDNLFATMEWLFGLFFMAELVVRLALFLKLRRDFWWNVLDTLFITAWLIELNGGGLGFDPTMLRLVRLVRLMRLARLVANYKIFDPLFLIFKSVQSSLSVLIWTVLLLFLLMMAVGMLIATLLQGFISDTSGDAQARQAIFLKWGTFLRASVSMFEITLANWGPPCWELMNHVNIVWGVFFILWRCCFGFAVIQVITSVFIQQTFKVASHDEDVMIKEKEKASSIYLKHMDTLFTELDESGDGKISRAEFDRILVEPRFRHFFAALEIHMSDVPAVFETLDNGDGEVTKDEFIAGLKKLKGVAQSMDMFVVLKDIQRLKTALHDIHDRMLDRSI